MAGIWATLQAERGLSVFQCLPSHSHGDPQPKPPTWRCLGPLGLAPGDSQKPTARGPISLHSLKGRGGLWV